jgi:RNA polymerase sigma-70 factor (ECF subfamily)
LSSLTDTELVAASCRGDKQAYTELIKRHYRAIFVTCFGMLGDVHDAEDIAQDALFKGLTEIAALRDGSQFGAWITRIARNASINLLRKKHYMEKTKEQLEGSIGREATQNIALHQAIQRLPQEIRLPLVMYYFDGQSVQKVAERLDISVSNVYQKLRTALKQLHNLLVE